MRPSVRFVMLLLATISLSLLCSCGSNGIVTIAASPSLAGNWNIAAVAAPSSPSQIASIGGALLVSSTGAVTGMLHALPVSGQDGSSLCSPTLNVIAVTGSLAADETLVLTSSNFAGNTLTVSGTYVAEAGTTLPFLRNATYSIAGPCGVPSQAVAAAQVPPLNGNYTGTAAFGSHPVNMPITASFSQASQPDIIGQYYVLGSASFGQDACVVSPVVMTSQVSPGG